MKIGMIKAKNPAPESKINSNAVLKGIGIGHGRRCGNNGSNDSRCKNGYLPERRKRPIAPLSDAERMKGQEKCQSRQRNLLYNYTDILSQFKSARRPYLLHRDG